MSFILYPFVRKAMTIGLLSLFWFGFGSCSHQEEGDTVKMSVEFLFTELFQLAVPTSHALCYTFFSPMVILCGQSSGTG